MARMRRVSLEGAERELSLAQTEYLRLITVPKSTLMQAIENELTPTQKKYIKDYYFNAKTLAQIAQENNIDISTVSRTVKRARSRLISAFRYYKSVK